MRKMPLLFSLAALFVIVGAFQSDAPTPTSTPALDASSSMRVYLDPATGQITSDPSHYPIDLDKQVANGLNRSSEGLVVEDSPVSGKMVRLDGRFREAGIATIDADGNLTSVYVDHIPATTDSDQ